MLHRNIELEFLPPFLSFQSEKVTNVLEALKEMTVKEPIQGYTCAKTKQEVNTTNVRDKYHLDM